MGKDKTQDVGTAFIYIFIRFSCSVSKSAIKLAVLQDALFRGPFSAKHGHSGELWNVIAGNVSRQLNLVKAISDQTAKNWYNCFYLSHFSVKCAIESFTYIESQSDPSDSNPNATDYIEDKSWRSRNAGKVKPWYSLEMHTIAGSLAEQKSLADQATSSGLFCSWLDQLKTSALQENQQLCAFPKCNVTMV